MIEEVKLLPLDIILLKYFTGTSKSDSVTPSTRKQLEILGCGSKFCRHEAAFSTE